jgi:predicted double-glycine peptidase
MRPLHLIAIACIFGAVIVLAAFILLTSPFLVSVPAPGAVAGSVKYGSGAPLPEPRYYTGIDFDSLKSNDHLDVIPLKSYRQQMTNYSCGAVAAMTVMSYYGMPVNNTDADEGRVAHEMYRNVTEKSGVNPEQVSAWFSRQGMNATWGTGGTREMLRENIRNGVPTMVEWMDWGGHWVVVVGYDTRGTENTWDDVIIFADSVDSHDDHIDGITYFNYGEFDAMWFDAHYFPVGMRDRAYVVAVPKIPPPPS